MHLIVSFVGCFSATWYMITQGLGCDFKEMMTAFVLLCIGVYHFFVSFWGLVQVIAFKRWCEECIECLKILGIGVVGVGEDSDDEFEQSSYRNNISHHVHVNNTIIENDFRNSQVPCSKDAVGFLFAALYGNK